MSLLPELPELPEPVVAAAEVGVEPGVCSVLEPDVLGELDVPEELDVLEELDVPALGVVAALLGVESVEVSVPVALDDSVVVAEGIAAISTKLPAMLAAATAAVTAEVRLAPLRAAAAAPSAVLRAIFRSSLLLRTLQDSWFCPNVEGAI